MNIKTKMTEIFNDFGIFISEDTYTEKINIDSFQFISLIVRIEETFSLMVDDEYLIKDKLTTFYSFCGMVENLLNKASHH